MKICTICARGGSKGVKDKNIRLLAGKPLIVHSIDQARQSKLFDAIAVSSDSDSILAVAAQAGVIHLVKRPEILASDVAPKLPAIRHCVEEVESQKNCRFETIVDLDATSPLRSIEDIIEAVQLLEQDRSFNIITGAESRRSPYFNMVEEYADLHQVKLVKQPAQSVKRRQDAPKCFDMNASIYVWDRDDLFSHDAVVKEKTRLHVMPEARSLDIDTPLDFEIVEFLLRKQLGHQGSQAPKPH